MAVIFEAKFCTDGLLFNDTNPNQERCDYPFNVDCGLREFVRKSPSFCWPEGKKGISRFFIFGV